jgi:hypothetical protein
VRYGRSALAGLIVAAGAAASGIAVAAVGGGYGASTSDPYPGGARQQLVDRPLSDVRTTEPDDQCARPVAQRHGGWFCPGAGDERFSTSMPTGGPGTATVGSMPTDVRP